MQLEGHSNVLMHGMRAHPALPSTHLSLLSSTAWMACTRLRRRCTRRAQGPPGGSDMGSPAPLGAGPHPAHFYPSPAQAACGAAACLLTECCPAISKVLIVGR